jgi:hypothetical protein
MVIVRKPCSIEEMPMGKITRVGVDIAKSILMYMLLTGLVRFNGKASIREANG